MVATDVASRGIGMLDRIFVVPFPFLLSSLLLTVCGSVWIALLSATDICVCSVLWSGLSMSHWVLLSKESWNPSAV